MATRRSTRRTKASLKREHESDVAESDVESEGAPSLRTDIDDDKGFVKKPARKKQKKVSDDDKTEVSKVAGKKVRGKRGALQLLTEMPLDILFEIFGNASPLDLINLTRTSTSLRKVLLEPSAQGVWKESQSNLEGLPDFPEDLTMQRYICLILETHCQRCLSQTAHICWEFRLRLCVNCVREDARFITNTYMYRDGVVLGCCPTVQMMMTTGRRRYNAKLYDEIYLQTNYHKYIAMDDKQKKQWATEERKRVLELRQHASACDKWLTNRAEIRANALEDIRDRRVAEIVQRLRNMGWGELIDNLPDKDRIETHPLVNQKKELTDRIWNNIKPSLLEYLEDQNEKCQEQIRQARIEARLPLLEQYHEQYMNSKPVNAVTPPIIAFIQFQPIQDFIFNTLGTVTADDIGKVAEENDIDSFCVRWKTEMDQMLLRMVTGLNGPFTKSEIDNAEITLRKATVAFHCEFCYSEIQYPRILMHEDINIASAFAPFTCTDPLLNFALEKLGTRSNDYGKTIHVKENYTLATETLLSACGLDLDASISEVDALDPFFECSCSSGKEVAVRSWRAAIQHQMSFFNKSPDHEYKLITDELALRKVRDRRNEAFLRDWTHLTYYSGHSSKYRRYICTICRFRGCGFEMKGHLANKHDKSTVENGDVDRYIDSEADKFEHQFPVDFLGGLFDH